MENDFCNCCFKIKPGIPSSPIRAIEATSFRTCVTEGGVDNTIIVGAANQLFQADPRQQVVFRGKAIICRMVKVEDVLKVFLVISDTI